MQPGSASSVGSPSASGHQVAGSGQALSAPAGAQPVQSFARRVLILFAHPALEKSRTNVVLAQTLKQIPGVTFHDLYEAYPSLDIDVGHEQTLLANHDVFLFQHPLFWYSTPAMLKEWQDLVLEHGWAYGRGGTALKGKLFSSIISTGGGQDAYREGGFNRFTLRQLLAPIEQTMYLCGVTYLAPFVTHGTHRMEPEQVVEVAGKLRRFVEALRDDLLDLDAAQEAQRSDNALVGLIRKGTGTK